MIYCQRNVITQHFHTKCLKVITTEVFKSLSKINPSCANEICNADEIPTDLRNSNISFQPKFENIIYGKTRSNITVHTYGIY